MNKPTLLYASPFPPVKSGISEYSSILVKELEKDFDITLYTEDYEITDKTLEHFPVLRHGVDEVRFKDYQYLLYNIGNQPVYHGYIYEAALQHPGFVIMHDASIYYLFVGYHQKKDDLYSSIYFFEGASTLKDIITSRKVDPLGNIYYLHSMATRYPLFRELLSSGSKYIVHSRFAKDRLLSSGLVKEMDVLKTGLVSMVEKDPVLIQKKPLLEKYGIPGESVIVAAFGFIAESKLNRETIHAVRRLAQESGKPLCYVMVGEGGYVDDKLAEGLIIKTGYVSTDEYCSFLEYADIVANLRNPTRGETSATLMQALEKGKPCLVNHGGWFSEVPDDCVCRVSLDNIEEEIYTGIKTLLTDSQRRESIVRSAKEYAGKAGSPDLIRKAIAGFLTQS